MKIRLMRDDAVWLEAITPDRVTIVIEDWDGSGNSCHLALYEENIDRLWRFLVLLNQWKYRIDSGQGPPDGFDRDITEEHGGWALPAANPEGK